MTRQRPGRLCHSGRSTLTSLISAQQSCSSCRVNAKTCVAPPLSGTLGPCFSPCRWVCFGKRIWGVYHEFGSKRSSLYYTATGQQLQESATDLQNRMGDVLLASKAVVEKLDPPAASLIQSECRLLTRSIVQLQRRTSGKAQSLKVMSLNMAAVFKKKKKTPDRCRLTRTCKSSVQDELEQQELFDTRLVLLEEQAANIENELKALKGDDHLEVGHISIVFPQ